MDAIVTQLASGIQEKIKKKFKALNVKNFQIKNHLWIFVNCLVENPAFGS